MQTCAVIGCGAAGITASTALRQCGMLVTCFELGAAPGGIWTMNSRDLFSARSLISPIYPSMRCVLPKELMCFSDGRFDFTVPEFPHHTSVAAYLEAYARRKGVHSLTRFNTKVESVRFDDGDGMWKVISVNVKNGDVLEWAFDRVCVCTGQTQRARFPEGIRETLAGFLEAGGELHHSSHVKDFRGLRGRRVVVVGDGVSAYDYCRELVRSGASVIHSSYSAGGRAGAAADLFARGAPAGDSAKRSADTSSSSSGSWDVVTAVADLVGRVPGWRSDTHRGNDVVRRWVHSRSRGLRSLQRVGRPIGCEGRGVHFGEVDAAAAGLSGEGVFIDGIDVVICATGFSEEFPFLHKSIRAVVEDETKLLAPSVAPAHASTVDAAALGHSSRGLYMGTILRQAPSLAFVGLQKELLPPFLVFEAQARFVAFAFSQRIALPATAADMMASEAELVRQNPLLADLYDRDGVGLCSAVYFNTLQQLLQVSSKDTYTAKILERRWWFLLSALLRVYHAFRAMAPLKRKKQHLLFSNKV